MNEFERYLETTSLKEDGKKDLKFFIEYLSGQHLTLFSSRIVLLVGEAGMGKTYLARKMLSTINLPIYYVGQEAFPAENVKSYYTIEELNECVNFEKDCVVFLDDMNYLAEEEFGETTNEHKRLMLSLFSKIKSSKARVGFLGTMNYVYFDSQLTDRTDIIITMEAPEKESKRIYLENKYSEHLPKKIINNLALKSIGHNFRDLDEVIRMSYRYGKGSFTKESINKALKTHMPSNFRYYDILNDIDINFNSIIGRKKIKDSLIEIKSLFKSKNKIKKYGLKRSNLLVFYGPPGTGKTYMAKAFAGEIGFPLVNISAFRLYREGPMSAFDKMLKFASRFKDSVILIDEADKLVGRSMYEEEGPLQGHINSVFDGITGLTDTIVIFTLNKIENFGEAFHDRFTKIEFDYPSDEERNLFLSDKIKKHSKIFDPSINIVSLSYMTRNMSFRDMEKIWGSIITRYIRTQKRILMEDFEELIKPQEKHDMMFG